VVLLRFKKVLSGNQKVLTKATDTLRPGAV